LRRVRGRVGQGLIQAVSKTVPGLLASRIGQLRRCAQLVLRAFHTITFRTESQDRGCRRRLGIERTAAARLGPANRQRTATFCSGQKDAREQMRRSNRRAGGGVPAHWQQSGFTEMGYIRLHRANRTRRWLSVECCAAGAALQVELPAHSLRQRGSTIPETEELRTYMGRDASQRFAGLDFHGFLLSNPRRDPPDAAPETVLAYT
jgi:hypothetical protein